MDGDELFVLTPSDDGELSQAGDEGKGGPEGNENREGSSTAASASITELEFLFLRKPLNAPLVKGSITYGKLNEGNAQNQQTPQVQVDVKKEESSSSNGGVSLGVGSDVQRVTIESKTASTLLSTNVQAEAAVNIRMLRAMTSADVRSVLKPFFHKNQTSMEYFEKVTTQLKEKVIAGKILDEKEKDMLERWRLLVNISNWGDGSRKADDVLFPPELVQPAEALLEPGWSSNKTAADETTACPPPTNGCKIYLRAHQLKGIRFMWSILAEGPVGQVPAVGCILAHTMGLGKTCQVIIFLHLFLDMLRKMGGSWYKSKKKQRRILIVVPKSTRAVWIEEFNMWSKFFPRDKRVVPLSVEDCTRVGQRVRAFNEWKTNGGVLLAGYEMLLNVAKCIGTTSQEVWNPSSYVDLLVCDEAHRLKSENLQIANVLRSFNPLRRLLITGTPLQNHLKEYWAMVDMAVWKYFNKQRFSQFFVSPIEAAADQKASSDEVTVARMKTFALSRELRNFVQCADGTALRKELPPLHEYVVVLPLSQSQAKLYNEFLQLARHSGARHRAFLEIAIAINKICAHPQLLYATGFATGEEGQSEALGLLSDGEGDDNFMTECPEAGQENVALRSKRRGLCQPPPGYVPMPEEGTKLYVSILIIKAAVLRGERCLFFSMSTKLLDIFEGIIAEMNDRWLKDGSLSRPIVFCRLDGRKTEWERSEALRSFASSTGADLFLLSTKAGGIGLTITSATRVIIADGSFNPADDTQAIGRAYRYGQTQPVYAYRLVCYQTFEHRMFQQKLAKEWLFRTVVEEASLKRDSLSGLRIQPIYELLNSKQNVRSGPQQLTDEQRQSTTSITSEDAVLADVSKHILYAERHSMFLQRDETTNLTAEERFFREEYEKNRLFDTDNMPDPVEGAQLREVWKQNFHKSQLEPQAKTLGALLDNIIKSRAEADPQLADLLSKMGIVRKGIDNLVFDASDEPSNSEVTERPQANQRNSRRDDENESKGYLPEPKAPRLESVPRVRRGLGGNTSAQSVLSHSNADSSCVGPFEPLVDPKFYGELRHGGSPYRPIYVDDDTV